MSYNTFTPIVTDGLVLYLDAANTKSYPGTGTSWLDLSKNGNNGVLTNGPIFTGDSFSFNGTQYVNFGNVLNLGTNSLTINIWVNLNTIVGQQTFISKAAATVQNYRFSVGVGYPSNGQIYAFMQGNGGTDILPYTSLVLSPNNWVMLTYIFDRVSSIKIYYNGVSQPLNSSSTISQWNGLNFQSINPFRVGTYTTADNSGVVALTNGKISLTQVYFRTLSDSEVLQNYNATKWRFIQQ